MFKLIHSKYMDIDLDVSMSSLKNSLCVNLVLELMHVLNMHKVIHAQS
jgi:hypothetical protein